MDKKIRAIVTGASEGLGKSIALELASRQIDLVLVSLPSSGLPELADYIRKNLGVKVTIFEGDLTSAEICKGLFDMLKSDEINITKLFFVNQFIHQYEN